jgi:hypothetical protein
MHALPDAAVTAHRAVDDDVRLGRPRKSTVDIRTDRHSAPLRGRIFEELPGYGAGELRIDGLRALAEHERRHTISFRWLV